MTVPVPVRLTMTLARPPKALISSERNGVWQVASPASTATISPGPETLNLSLSDAVGTIFPSLSATFTSTKTMSSDEYVRERAGAQSPPNSVEGPLPYSRAIRIFAGLPLVATALSMVFPSAVLPTTLTVPGS